MNEDVSAEDRTEDTKAKIKDNIMSHVSSAGDEVASLNKHRLVGVMV